MMAKSIDYANLIIRDDQKKYIRGQLPRLIEMFTERDPKWKQYYLCISDDCKERTHTHSTGGAFYLYPDKLRFECFSCGIQGDSFDLIGYVFKIKSGNTDLGNRSKEFKLEYVKACELLNLPLDFTPSATSGEEAAPAPSGSTPGAPAASGSQGANTVEFAVNTDGLFKDYLEKCHAACVEGSKGYDYLVGRGLTAETIDRFKLGYDSEHNCVTIPYNLNYSYYITREIGSESKHNKPSKDIAGDEPCFNESALYADSSCFVCESPLDAISIMQAGGNAIATGGLKFAKLIAACNIRKPLHSLIISYDHDDPGMKGQKEAVKALTESGIDFIEGKFSYDKYSNTPKDANEMLQCNPDQLAADVLENIKANKDHELETGSALYPVRDYQSLFKRHRTETKQRISTGFKSMDIGLYGGFGEELYILSAATSIGKSAVSCVLAQNIAQSGIDVLYYALEMGRDEFIARGASMISKEEDVAPIPYAEILNFRYDEDSDEFYRTPYSRYEKYVDEYMRRYGEHLYFIEAGFYGKTALGIAETVETFKKTHGVTQLVVVVDYLQRLSGDPNDRAQRDAMSITSAAVQVLGNLATQCHTTVLAISSISNAQQGHRVDETAGKYSGDIAYTGGILLGWNWKGYTDTKDTTEKETTANECKDNGYRNMYFDILKQRSGERDQRIDLIYYPAYNYFEAPVIEGSFKPAKKKGGKKK